MVTPKNVHPGFDYDSNGNTYSINRQTDDRIASYVFKELYESTTILNIGAGAGSYEPKYKYVVAIEPSYVMRQQRLKLNKVPALNLSAENIPFDDDSFDASMAMITIHHWTDIKKGLKELRRVTKNKILILTFDPNLLNQFWGADYFPEVIEVEKNRYPSIDFIQQCLGGNLNVIPIPIPLDCKDGFQEAFYGRPELFLQKQLRMTQSAWSFIPDDQEETIVDRLKIELENGEWDKKYGHLKTQSTFMGSLCLLVSTP